MKQLKYINRVRRFVRSAAPFLAGLAGCALSAHAGPIQVGLAAVGQDLTAGMQVAGVGMLGWTGMRIFLDEHHSINPGRVVGGIVGGMFTFAPQAIQAWVAGF